MLEISDLEQIRALASPMRQAIVDSLEALGPSTAAELGELLDVRPDALYYHLRILTRCGLVREQPRSAAEARAGAVFDVAGRPTRLRYAPFVPEKHRAIVGLVGSMLRSALRAFRRNLNPGAITEGRRRELWAGRRTAWLTPEGVEEVNGLIEQLVRVMEREGARQPEGRLYAFTFVLSPFGGGRRRSGVRGGASPGGGST